MVLIRHTPAKSTKEARRQQSLLSLRQLRRFLKTGAALPKDAFADTNIAGLQGNPFRYRDRQFERALLHSLVCESASADQHQLALTICNCRHGHRCRRLRCFICNQKYWRKRRSIAETFSDAAPSELSWCTVVIGASQEGYPVLSDMIKAFKASFTQILSRYPDAGWSGRLEIDYLDLAISPPNPNKAETLNALGWVAECEMATLVPHAHLLLLHPGVRRETVAYHLKRAFRAPRQVQLRALRTTRDRHHSLDSLTRYPIKPPLDRPFIGNKRSKGAPRCPEVLRYVQRIHECLDHPDHRGLLEFDNC